LKERNKLKIRLKQAEGSIGGEKEKYITQKPVEYKHVPVHEIFQKRGLRGVELCS